MATTSNFKVDLINTSDYISPEKINAGFTKMDEAGLDYIVEESIPAASDQWWYRKWKSGRMECGVDFKYFGRNDLTTEWVAGLYSGNSMTFGAYPKQFVSRPFATVSFLADDRMSDGRTSWVAMNSTKSTSQSPSFMLMDHSRGESYGYYGIYVCGRWK